MLKKTIIAGFAMFIAIFAFEPVQDAQAKVKVYIGNGGYYGGGYNPYYRDPYYRPRPRYYDPVPYYGNPYPPRRRYIAPHRRGRISCARGKRIVRNRGFYKVKARDCRGRNYMFHARKNGKKYRVYVKSRNGRVYRINRR